MTTAVKTRRAPKNSAPPQNTAAPVAAQPDGCWNCRFYLLAGGFCRRYPAQPVASKTTRNGAETVVAEWQSVFPSMLPGGWCGEHKR